ncbi:MAG: hybrid sensor histidine kinase/response regulator [Cyanobacteria bacterium P01_A01_bin.83]
MDTEQQIRLNFLDEAEEYFDLMESNLVGLAENPVSADRVDLILRSAHSIKGGAAMMGFEILSRIAHRLEDFFKILRLRYVATEIETEIESLLLSSVDLLRDLASLHRQEVKVDESEIDRRCEPILTRLREHLGDLDAADESALLAQNEDFDPAVLIFEEGVEGVLDRFETNIAGLKIAELTQELTTTAEELIGFGNMVGLDSFVQLCQSIQQQADGISDSEIASLAQQALKTWRRSHALVLRGSTEKIPSYLEGFTSETNSLDLRTSEELKLESLDLGGLQSAFEAETLEEIETESVDFDNLQSAFETETSEELESEPIDLGGLQSAFETESIDLGSLQSAFTVETSDDSLNTIPIADDPQTDTVLSQTAVPEKAEKMMRVPASQLQEFNVLFEQLVLNRNSINLRLEQLENTVTLMSQRIVQMERSNTNLKQWYDRASVEGVLDNTEQLVAAAVLSNNKSDCFDSLEMDRYTDIHLICQEQIETIVQLQEVATDIKLGIQEVHQSARELYYTTKSMQGNVTRTQMLPFADAVKRCHRLIRDLNLKFGKKVKLEILGERTLLDRSAIEVLSDPLMHLLRNSFDHGIEESEVRIERGKPESGTITIQATNRGTYTVITLSDDGGGINLHKIRDRLCQMGFTPAETQQIPEAELLDFIFEPGFSTAAQVTELSGRGVGMDVVKTSLQEIGGNIKLETQPGQGTIFTLRIPFSLSILRVAILEQGGVIFAVPANSIRELIATPPDAILCPNNPDKIDWNHQQIPLIEIDKIFVYRHAHHSIALTGNPTINQTMTLVVEDETAFAALKIDRFWDEQESTTRAIESPIPLPPGVVSSVILGDGKVIPLIDPLALINADSDRQQFDLDSPEAINNNLTTVKTILIVDDSINIRRYLSLTLEKAGYKVEQAKDGREAVDKLLGGLDVQAVICDVEMPRLDGYGVLEEIKEKVEFATLPIAMLTSRSNDKHRQLAMNLGASAYFAKPYNETELLNTLGSLLP